MAARTSNSISSSFSSKKRVSPSLSPSPSLLGKMSSSSSSSSSSSNSKAKSTATVSLPVALFHITIIVAVLWQFHSLSTVMKRSSLFHQLELDDKEAIKTTHGMSVRVTNAHSTSRQRQKRDIDVDGIQLHIIAWKRHKQLQALLDQLSSADYNYSSSSSGWKDDSISVELFIHLEGEASQEVVRVAENYQWAYGNKVVQQRDQRVGLKRMWFDSIGKAAMAAGNNTLMLVLEDDVVVSPFYFQWLLGMMEQFAPTRQARDKDLVGFSLSPIVWQELYNPHHAFDALQEMGSSCNNNDDDNNNSCYAAYLTSVPSSWASAYWSDVWQDFDQFAKIRTKYPYFYEDQEETKVKHDSERVLTPKCLELPNCNSNIWPKSWKRFMVDYMYGRGLVMLYPSLPNQEGLGTALQQDGEHIKKDQKKNPRVSTLVKKLDMTTVKKNLPLSLDQLFVFDMKLKPTSRIKLKDVGYAFLENAAMACPNNFTNVLNLWARPDWRSKLFDDDTIARQKNLES